MAFQNIVAIFQINSIDFSLFVFVFVFFAFICRVSRICSREFFEIWIWEENGF